jgi:large subunit ribosomal protein L10
VLTQVKLDQKKEIVQGLNEKFSSSAVVILTDYKGLNVAKMNELRRKLQEANVEYQVVKNTLLRRAAEGTDVAAIVDQFTGPSAVAISMEDPVAPAKVLSDFAKDNDKLEIRAAVMEGKALGPDGIKALSSLPSREVLLGQLLNALNGVPTSLVRVLNAVPQNLMNVLAAIKDQKEEAGA